MMMIVTDGGGCDDDSEHRLNSHLLEHRLKNRLLEHMLKNHLLEHRLKNHLLEQQLGLFVCCSTCLFLLLLKKYRFFFDFMLYITNTFIIPRNFSDSSEGLFVYVSSLTSISPAIFFFHKSDIDFLWTCITFSKVALGSFWMGKALRN